MHDFVIDRTRHTHICERCGSAGSHHLRQETRWGHGGFDDIGPYLSKEEVWDVCADCGSETLVGYTGGVMV